MIEIREALSRKEQKRFIEFPLKLYKGNPYFVPPLYADEKAMFKKDYCYNAFSKSVFYNAYKDGKMVGRISGILHYGANEKWGTKQVRFTRFDCIDDQEVANALFEKVAQFAKENGMEELVGPLGYCDMEREGLLIEGFDYLSTYEEQYNYPYYQKLIENYGFTKDVDWTERRLYPPEKIDPTIEKLVARIMERNHFRVAEFKSMKEIIDKYADAFFELVDESYSGLYQTVPFLEGQRKDIIKAFKVLLSPRYIRLIVNEKDELVAFGLCFPPIGKALQRSGGRLTPWTLCKIFHVIRHPKVLDLGLVGVSKRFQNTGAAWVIFLEMMHMLKDGEFEYYETNLNLEDNLDIQNNWNRFPNIIHKRRRAFIKKIEGK